MPKSTEVKSNRDRYSERLKTKYPDKEFVDDEALFGQINDDYDNYDKEISKYKEREKAFSDLFTSDPRSASFLTRWRKGEHPLVAMVRVFGPEAKDAFDDPEIQEQLMEASKEWTERVTQEDKYEEEYHKNIEETNAILDEMEEKGELTPEDTSEAITFLAEIIRDGIVGKFSRESILMALKAIRHDTDVEQADREGEVRGRNTKIEEKLRKQGKNDGTANLAGKNGGGKGAAREMPDMGAIGRYDGVQNIWERGGEKRRSINK